MNSAINFLKKRVFRFPFALSSIINMDEDDVIMNSRQKIQQSIRKDEKRGISNYIKSTEFPPVDDFKKGLEWFNVSEPISFDKHLKGKIVILDFFTYCCINCMHILPDLKELEKEFSIEDGLVVIGVHSAKFENEKISSNILAAVQRYNIAHPVVNDYNMEMWKNCDVHCWPTLLMLGPNANPLVMLTGEGHKTELRQYIKGALEHYKSLNQISNHSLPLKSAFHLLPDLKGPLLFPGKITNTCDSKGNEIIAISDTGNNRILIVNHEGLIYKQIGSGKVGFKDGTIDKAQFNNPQGLIFKNESILFVADTENHAIRKVDLINDKVETIAGTGVQGNEYKGGKIGTQQAISSPWDLVLYKTKDLDSNELGPEKEVLIIAMAGTHQIWAIFLDDTIWWKKQKYSSGTCVAIAGSGREENRNNNYPHAAAFAQPSGLVLCSKNKEVYIADSESSSVRKLSLVDGKVSAVVGGNKNPNNLFAFGDKDGSLYEAKLQHALGLGISADESIVFVADTYNHKLKKINISKNEVTTMTIPSNEKLTLQEPGGLCFSTLENKIYLADTNNHYIRTIALKDDHDILSISNLELTTIDNVDKADETVCAEVIKTKPLEINSKGGKIVLTIDLAFEEELHLTEDVPQKWEVRVPSSTWSCVPNFGETINNLELVLSVPKLPKIEENVRIHFSLVTCTDEACLPKSFMLTLPIIGKSEGATNLYHNMTVVLTPTNVSV